MSVETLVMVGVGLAIISISTHPAIYPTGSVPGATLLLQNSQSSSTSGVIGGGQAGYNWQLNNFFLLVLKPIFRGRAKRALSIRTQQRPVQRSDQWQRVIPCVTGNHDKARLVWNGSSACRYYQRSLVILWNCGIGLWRSRNKRSLQHLFVSNHLLRGNVSYPIQQFFCECRLGRWSGCGKRD